VLAAVEAGHELGVAHPDSEVVAGRLAAGALGVLPGQRVPDAEPLVRPDLARGRDYRQQYAAIDRPEFDELFAVDDRVVVAYTLRLHRQDGSTELMAVMAIWTVSDGKVAALREVDAPIA
jgi:hypothetical protein